MNSTKDPEKLKRSHWSLTVGPYNHSCSVCGDRAVSHLHYGAISCFSCRVFFRRAVDSGTFRNYVCRDGLGRCPVGVQTRRTCPKCRFEKCVTQGMRVGLVEKSKKEGGGKKKKDENEENKSGPKWSRGCDRNSKKKDQDGFIERPPRHSMKEMFKESGFSPNQGWRDQNSFQSFGQLSSSALNQGWGQAELWQGSPTLSGVSSTGGGRGVEEDPMYSKLMEEAEGQWAKRAEEGTDDFTKSTLSSSRAPDGESPPSAGLLVGRPAPQQDNSQDFIRLLLAPCMPFTTEENSLVTRATLNKVHSYYSMVHPSESLLQGWVKVLCSGGRHQFGHEELQEFNHHLSQSLLASTMSTLDLLGAPPSLQAKLVAKNLRTLSNIDVSAFFFGTRSATLHGQVRETGMANPGLIRFLERNALAHVVPRAKFEYFNESPWAVGPAGKDYPRVMRELGTCLGNDVNLLSAVCLMALVSYQLVQGRGGVDGGVAVANGGVADDGNDRMGILDGGVTGRNGVVGIEEEGIVNGRNGGVAHESNGMGFAKGAVMVRNMGMTHGNDYGRAIHEIYIGNEKVDGTIETLGGEENRSVNHNEKEMGVAEAKVGVTGYKEGVAKGKVGVAEGIVGVADGTTVGVAADEAISEYELECLLRLQTHARLFLNRYLKSKMGLKKTIAVEAKMRRLVKDLQDMEI